MITLSLLHALDKEELTLLVLLNSLWSSQQSIVFLISIRASAAFFSGVAVLRIGKCIASGENGRKAERKYFRRVFPPWRLSTFSGLDGTFAYFSFKTRGRRTT